MARSGALTMFIVTGITAFTRTTLEDGVVVALAALAGSLVVVGVVTALIKRSPAGMVARAMSSGTRFDRRLERVLPVPERLDDGAHGARLGSDRRLVVSGIWTGLVSVIIGAWIAWEGWRGIADRRRRPRRSRCWL